MQRLATERVAAHRRPDLDGLRGIAVLTVMAFHFGALFGKVPGTRNPFLGGYLGVDVFFVISGSLITGLLVREWQRSQGISLKSFWTRRIRRIVPAMLVMVAADGLLWIQKGFAVHSVLVSDAWIVPFLANVGKIQGELHPSVGHTWTLAVEEQFYLFWPPILMLMLRRGGLRAARLAAATIALAAVGVTAWRFHLNHDSNEGYWATWGRVPQLLVGALVGLNYERIRPPRWLRLFAAAGVVLGILYIRVPQPWLYEYGGMAGCAVVVAVLITHPPERDPVAWLLEMRWLQWVGRLSYSLYLWSVLIEAYAVIQFYDSAPVVRFAASLPLAFLLAYLSYRFIELPMTRGGSFAPGWYVTGRPAAPWLGAAAVILAGAGLLTVTIMV